MTQINQVFKTLFRSWFYVTHNQNLYELSVGGIRNIGDKVSLILNNSMAYAKFNYSNTAIQAYEYLFLGYSDFRIKQHFSLGIGVLYYTNFHSNKVIPVIALGLNYKKLSVTANLPINLGINYKLTDNLSIIAKGDLLFGTLEIPHNNPGNALAKEMDMIDLRMTMGIQYKLKGVLLSTNFGLNYVEKTYIGTSNLKIKYPESLYLEFGLSFVD